VRPRFGGTYKGPKQMTLYRFLGAGGFGVPIGRVDVTDANLDGLKASIYELGSSGAKYVGHTFFGAVQLGTGWDHQIGYVVPGNGDIYAGEAIARIRVGRVDKNGDIGGRDHQGQEAKVGYVRPPGTLDHMGAAALLLGLLK